VVECVDNKLCTTALSVCNIVAVVPAKTALVMHGEGMFRA
jgi:hypothetical protein